MPNAIISSTNYAGNGTQLGFINALNSAMLTAGFSQLKAYQSSGNENIAWNYLDTDNGNAAFDNLIIDVGFSAATTLRIRGFSSFNTGDNTGQNVSAAAPTASITLANSFTFNIINHPECRMVEIMTGTSNIFTCGYLRPLPSLTIGSTQVNAWWNRNSSPMAFIHRTITWNDFTSASLTLQPISSLRPGSVGANIGVLNINSQNGASGNLNLRFPKPATVITNNSPANEEGLVFSSDLLLAPAGGMVFGDTMLGGTYTMIEGSASTYHRLFIKTS